MKTSFNNSIFILVKCNIVFLYFCNIPIEKCNIVFCIFVIYLLKRKEIILDVSLQKLYICVCEKVSSVCIPIPNSSLYLYHSKRIEYILEGNLLEKNVKRPFCFHTPGVLHIFVLYNLLGPGISFHRKSKINVKRKPNYEIG